MIRRFTDAELAEYSAFYAEHGAVRLPQLLQPESAAALLREVDTAADHADEDSREYAESYGGGPGRLTIRYMWRKNPKIRNFLLDPALVEAVAKIVGTRELRLWFDLTFIHAGGDAGGDGSRWHHDGSAFVWKGLMLPSLWMALTPTRADRSRLEFIDGSHRRCPGYYRPPTNSVDDGGTAQNGYLPVPDFNALIAEGRESVLTWDCEVGDAIVIHPLTVHGAKGVKPGGERRVAMTTRWLGDDCRWVPGFYDGGGRSIPGLVTGDGAPPYFLGDKPSGDLFPLVYRAETAH